VTFVTKRDCVYCAVRTESLNIIYVKFSLSKAVQCLRGALSRRPQTAESLIWFQLNPCESCGRQSSSGKGFTPIASVFPCQYHSSNVPCTCSSTRCSFQKDIREK